MGPDTNSGCTDYDRKIWCQSQAPESLDIIQCLERTFLENQNEKNLVTILLLPQKV